MSALPRIRKRPTLRVLNVLLRPPRPSDKTDWLACGRNPELVRLYGNNPDDLPPFKQEVNRWYAATRRDSLSWMIEADSRCIGHVRLHSLDAPNRRARLAIGIFNPNYWGRGFGTEAVRLVLQHAFEGLHLHRVDLRTLSYNLRAIKSFEKCGFVREGVERESALVSGRWESDLLMSILEHEYRRVRAKHAEELYRTSEVSLERAAELAGLSVRAMMEHLRRRKIPSRYDRTSLQEDLASIKARARKK